MSEWYYGQNGKQHGPVSAKQLKQLAASGELAATDYVHGCGAWVSAGKIAGLIYDIVAPHNQAIINILFQGTQTAIDLSPWVTVKFDGKVLGKGTVVKGFNFRVETQPGQHEVGVKVEFLLKREKRYVLNIQEPSIYNVSLAYNIIWANFLDQCNLSVDSSEVHASNAANQLWQAEREEVRCPACRAEWAGDYLGNQVVNREYVPRTVIEFEDHMMQNPNYGPLTAAYEPPYFRGETRKNVQKLATVVTVRHFFQCEQCCHKWARDTVGEYIQ